MEMNELSASSEIQSHNDPPEQVCGSLTACCWFKWQIK